MIYFGVHDPKQFSTRSLIKRTTDFLYRRPSAVAFVSHAEVSTGARAGVQEVAPHTHACTHP